MAATALPLRHLALDALAELFLYPTPERVSAARSNAAVVIADCPGAADDLGPLVEVLADGELSDAEELYVRTLELNPLCALEIGWQLYGEQYARGTFLVRTRQLLRDAGLPETTELPDHLTNVLRILGRLDDESTRKLAQRFTLPALTSMQEKLAGNTAALAFGLAVIFVYLLLAAHYESVVMPFAVILI